jgi:hypothetical protein
LNKKRTDEGIPDDPDAFTVNLPAAGRSRPSAPAALAADLAAAGARFVAAVAALTPLAEELAHVDAELRAAEGRAGQRRPGRGACELAAEIVLGGLAALRPHLPFVTTASADAASVLLCQPYQRGGQERGEITGHGGDRGNQHAAKVTSPDVATLTDPTTEASP